MNVWGDMEEGEKDYLAYAQGHVNGCSAAAKQEHTWAGPRNLAGDSAASFSSKWPVWIDPVLSLQEGDRVIGPNSSLLSVCTALAVYFCSASHRRQSILSLGYGFDQWDVNRCYASTGLKCTVPWGLQALLHFTVPFTQVLNWTFKEQSQSRSCGLNPTTDTHKRKYVIILCHWVLVCFVMQWKLTDTASKWNMTMDGDPLSFSSADQIWGWTAAAAGPAEITQTYSH